MIKNQKELVFYEMADLMINRGVFKRSFIGGVKEFIDPDYVIRYLKIYRRMQYFSNNPSLLSRIMLYFYNVKKNRLGAKLGFYIGGDYGYALSIPHYGTIVAGGIVGNYAVLHSSTCITGSVRKIGNGLYLSTGAKISGDVKIGNNVTVAPNAVVCKSRKGDNIYMEGIPAEIRREGYPAWYERDGERFASRVKKIEKLKLEMGLDC